jgi:hypothetical protein
MPDTRLKGINAKIPFTHMNDWYEYQEKYINQLDITQYDNKPYFLDKVELSEVILYKNKKLISEETTLACYSDRLLLNGNVLPFADISVISVLGKNKLNIYYLDQVLQIKGEKTFNAVKYVNLFYRWQNLHQKKEDYGQFLGL